MIALAAVLAISCLGEPYQQVQRPIIPVCAKTLVGFPSLTKEDLTQYQDTLDKALVEALAIFSQAMPTDMYRGRRRRAQMVELFQTSKQNISLHIRNVFEEGELREESTVKEYLTVQNEGERQVQRSITYYNLDVIISVGYRVRSHIGTQFRIWATQRLRDYVIKAPISPEFHSH